MSFYATVVDCWKHQVWISLLYSCSSLPCSHYHRIGNIEIPGNELIGCIDTIPGNVIILPAAFPWISMNSVVTVVAIPGSWASFVTVVALRKACISDLLPLPVISQVISQVISPACLNKDSPGIWPTAKEIIWSSVFFQLCKTTRSYLVSDLSCMGWFTTSHVYLSTLRVRYSRTTWKPECSAKARRCYENPSR